MKPISTILILTLVASIASAQERPPIETGTHRPLDQFIARDQPAYAWSVVSSDNTAGARRLRCRLTSQTWKTGNWTHDLWVYRPDNLVHDDTAILFINGGSNGRKPDAAIELACVALAVRSGMTVAALFQVPNQPLLGGRGEDALIAATWLKYLDTEDPDWPLLFPMVRSAVSGMDAIGEITQQEFERSVNRFVVTGASKRGWTTWLSAAADERVIGIAPMVIDTLNFQAQIEDQKNKWGYYSEQISDYTENGLVNPDDESPAMIKLRRMMDPYEYRERIRIPKLLVHGSNDRYWRCDAMDNYWDGLVGPKNVLTIPNAGHSLGAGKLTAINSIGTFADACSRGRNLPNVTWKTEVDRETRLVSFEVDASEPFENVTFWVAESPTRDFRDSKFEAASPSQREKTHASINRKVADGRHVAVFAELRFKIDGTSVTLSSGVSQPEVAIVNEATGQR